jgi:hypothetical protein
MRVLSTFILLVIVSCMMLLFSTNENNFASALDDKLIRCKVCERAIDYIWHQGDNLRAHCKSPDRDHPGCDHSNMHHYTIEEMTREVCKKLPKTHQAIEESEFDLVLHEDPQHPEHVSDQIYRTCVKWVHDEHGLDNVAMYMYANLDAGKHRDTILHALRHKFCKNACNPYYEHQPRRKMYDNHRTPNAANSVMDKELNGDL